MAAVRKFAGVLFVALACALPLGATAVAEPLPLPIIVYHQIRADADGPPDSLETISLERFESQMQHLHERGYTTLSGEEVVNIVHGEKPSATKIVAIHFDDGWKSAQLALPALDRYAFKATFWIIAGTGIGKPHMDWVEIQAIGRNPRYDMHSHTMTHPWTRGDRMLDWMNAPSPGKDAEQVRWELAESRQVLAAKLSRPIPFLAWPGGRYNDAMIQIATESGYRALFTIASTR